MPKRKSSVRRPPPHLRFLSEYSVTVTLTVSASTKARAIANVRACLSAGPAPRITSIAAKESP